MEFHQNTSPAAANTSPHTGQMRVWQVGALCQAVADAIEARFGAVSVQGELSGFSRAASGHCYFTLKDANGQLRCAMFRRAAGLLNWQPRDGDRVEVRGRLAVYAARGDLQLVAESMSRAGQGALFEEFLRIKADLQAQGLFDEARKRPPSPYPRVLGLVTSLGAAALHDVASALRRRAPHVPVLLLPAPVQGADAPAALVAALRQMYAIISQQQAGEPTPGIAPIDTILLVRGGGAIEDLWAFNSPLLAQTIAHSPVPLIAGVGHESDFTIADFCADVRAPTPTAAAELAAVPQQTALQHLHTCQQRIGQSAQRQLDQHSQRLDQLAWGLAHTGKHIHQHSLHLHALAMRLRQTRTSSARAQHLQHLQTRLLQAAARHSSRGQHASHLQHTAQALQQAARTALGQQQTCVQALQQRWQQALAHNLHNQHQALQRCSTSLRLLHPQHILERGFALLQDGQGRVLSRREQFKLGQVVQATVSDGVLALTPVAQQGDFVGEP